jgi:4-amino-4-deoxy-L-arabinose transferase-like glycosyltransferase
LALTEDEAYYRLWSMAPALGYFDHPPMIAWWIWIGRHLAGDTALGVRLAPILSSAAVSLLVVDMAQLIGAGRAEADRAGLWFNATLLVAMGGLLATPDAPAALFWSLSLWACLRARRSGALAWWGLAGAAAGLAALSKYSALFLAPGVLLWLACTPGGRRELARPGPWLAALIAVSLFGLNIAWNATHDWLTFHKQFGRIAATRFAPRYLAEWLIEQILLLTPIIAAFAVGAFRPRGPSYTESADLTPMIAVTLPFAGYLAVHALHDRVQAHWPAPLYPGLAICAAVAAGRWAAGGGGRGWLRTAPLVTPAILALLALYLALPLSLTGRFDPLLPVRGWPLFARRLEETRRQTGAQWVGAASYGLTAQLAARSEIGAPIFQIAERERWSGLTLPAPDLSKPGLVVDLTRRVSAPGLGRCFEDVEPLGVIRRGDAGEPGKVYAIFLVAHPRRDLIKRGCAQAAPGRAS